MPLTTPLDSWHRSNAATMTVYAGWQMPLSYKRSGIITEHLSVRHHAGLFDVSHMLVVHTRQPLDRLIPIQFSALAPGQARYGFMPNPNGGVIDDLIVSRLNSDHWQLVLNAAQADIDRQWLNQHLAEPVTVIDHQALLALQGPAAAALLASVTSPDLLSLPKMHWMELDSQFGSLTVHRCGYTGEDGFEIALDQPQAPELADALINKGAIACGLAARDSLRIEAGLPLYGQELDHQTSALDSGLERFIHPLRRQQADFIGADRLSSADRQQAIIGLLINGKIPARKGAAVFLNDQPVGVVTSGVFSPSLNTPIALARVQRQAETADHFQIVVRQQQKLDGQRVSLPFVKPTPPYSRNHG